MLVVWDSRMVTNLLEFGLLRNLSRPPEDYCLRNQGGGLRDKVILILSRLLNVKTVKRPQRPRRQDLWWELLYNGNGYIWIGSDPTTVTE